MKKSPQNQRKSEYQTETNQKTRKPRKKKV